MTNDYRHVVSNPALEEAARKAVLPFRIIQEMGVACGYERSFKLLAGRVLANRYLLGINTDELPYPKMLGICDRLEMPSAYRDAFAAHVADANLVFLGFEDNEESGCVYRLYLEFWDKRQKDIQATTNRTEPVLLHLGFKWNADDSTQRAISRYMWYPSLSLAEILHRLSDIYLDQSDRTSFEIAKEIIEVAGSRSVDKSLVYLEVFEENSLRRSFDINVYRAGLRLRDIYSSLLACTQNFSIPDQQFGRLYPLVADKYFGHLSGGVNREGRDFLTFYYEAQTEP